MQIGIWLGILVSAVVAFIVGDAYGQPLHWYLFILIVFTGFFINTIILILKAKDESAE
jgi:ABC-type multidrug transport system permease subunit